MIPSSKIEKIRSGTLDKVKLRPLASYTYSQVKKNTHTIKKEQYSIIILGAVFLFFLEKNALQAFLGYNALQTF
jgi:hypothetical protein